MAYNLCSSCVSTEEMYPYCLPTCQSYHNNRLFYQARIVAKDISEAVEKIYQKYKNITELRIWLSHVQPYEEPWYEYSVTCDGKKV